MHVTRWLRLPVIGTSIVASPALLRDYLIHAAVSSLAPGKLFNFELHGIDLADATLDGLPPELVARQPDLRRTLAWKHDALDTLLRKCRAAGARFVPLREAVTELGF